MGLQQERSAISTIDRNPEVFPSRFLARSLDESWRSYRRRLRRFRRRNAGQSVHKLRLRGRRLLTSLELLDALLSDRAIRKARVILKEQFATLGALRDVQVQLRRFDRLSLSEAKLRSLRERLKRRERRLGQSVAEIKESKLSRQIARVSQRLALIPGDAVSNRQFRSGLSQALRDALGRVKTLQPRRSSELARLHHARIAIKQYCYLAELLRMVAPEADPRLTQTLHARQRLMGDIHDLQLFMAQLGKWAAKGDLAGGELQTVRASLARRRSALIAAFFQSARKPLPG